MTIKDYRLLEAATKLIEIAKIVEEDVGVGELSKTLKESATTLANIVRIQEWVK